MSLTDQLLTEKQAADRLTIKTSTLRAWRCHKKGPEFIKLHGAVRYPISNIKEFIENCTVKTEQSTQSPEDVLKSKS